HRIGGLEKQDVTGNVSYDPANHERMVQLRAAKVANIQPPGEPFVWTGDDSGDVLLVGWGRTFGALKAATLQLREQGLKVSHCHVRYLNPLPDLAGRLKQFRHVIVPELNSGQLRMLIRSRWLIDARGLNKVRGQPFTVGELVRGVRAVLQGT